MTGNLLATVRRIQRIPVAVAVIIRVPGVDHLGAVAAALLVVVVAAPDDHLAVEAGPDRGVVGPVGRGVGLRRRHPGVGLRIVAAATPGIGSRVVDSPAPDDHLPAGPDGAVTDAAHRGARKVRRRPLVGHRIVPGAVVHVLTVAQPAAAPDDHLGAGPGRRVQHAALRTVSVGRGRLPGVRRGVVAAPAPDLRKVVAASAAAAARRVLHAAPDDHHSDLAGPDRLVVRADRGDVGAGRGCRPAVPDGIVATARVQEHAAGGAPAAPDDHLAARPDRAVGIAALGRGRRLRRGPRVTGRVVSPARGSPPDAAPDDHLRAGPDRRVLVPGARRVHCRGGSPRVQRRVVTAAGVQRVVVVVAAPDDHLGAGPDRGVVLQLPRDAGPDEGRRPGVRVRIVPPARVGRIARVVVLAAPDDHDPCRVGPYRGVVFARRSARRRCSSPTMNPRPDRTARP